MDAVKIDPLVDPQASLRAEKIKKLQIELHQAAKAAAEASNLLQQKHDQLIVLLEEDRKATLDYLERKKTSITSALEQAKTDTLITLEQRRQAASQTISQLNSMNERMASEAKKADFMISLRVGGVLFTTSKDTLISQSNSYFSAMLGSGKWRPSSDGAYHIDRDADCFRVILRYLRDGIWDTRDLSQVQYEALYRDADYFQIKVPPPIKPEPTSTIDSLIFTEWGDKLISSWLPPSSKIGALLYRATRDGFEASKFHTKCDNQGPTVVVIRSSNSSFGFASVSWKSSRGWLAAPGSFIFLLHHPVTVPTKFTLKPDSEPYALYANADWGACFGADLQLYHNANKNGIYVAFPQHYQDTTGRGSSLFATKSVQEIEVFKVTVPTSRPTT